MPSLSAEVPRCAAKTQGPQEVSDSPRSESAYAVRCVFSLLAPLTAVMTTSEPTMSP